MLCNHKWKIIKHIPFIVQKCEFCGKMKAYIKEEN